MNKLKSILFGLITVTILTVFLTSCEKESFNATPEIQQKSYNNNFKTGKDNFKLVFDAREELAKELSILLKDEAVASIIVEETKKKQNGDFVTLYATIKDKVISKNRASLTLENAFAKKNSKIKGIEKNDPLLSLYLHNQAMIKANGNLASLTRVYVHKSEEDKMITYFENGTKYTQPYSDVPNFPVLVIKTNERFRAYNSNDNTEFYSKKSIESLGKYRVVFEIESDKDDLNTVAIIGNSCNCSGPFTPSGPIGPIGPSGPPGPSGIILCDCPPTCNDGIQNGNETDIDCGGNCPPCNNPPSCNDGVQNGNEHGVDCGCDCPPCPPNGCGGVCERECINDDEFLQRAKTSHDWEGLGGGEFYFVITFPQTAYPPIITNTYPIDDNNAWEYIGFLIDHWDTDIYGTELFYQIYEDDAGLLGDDDYVGEVTVDFCDDLNMIYTNMNGSDSEHDGKFSLQSIMQ